MTTKESPLEEFKDLFSPENLIKANDFEDIDDLYNKLCEEVVGQEHQTTVAVTTKPPTKPPTTAAPTTAAPTTAAPTTAPEPTTTTKKICETEMQVQVEFVLPRTPDQVREKKFLRFAQNFIIFTYRMSTNFLILWKRN